MYVKFNGVVSNLQAGDTVDKLEIVWKLGAESEAAAIAAGRTVTFQAPTDAAMIAAFQDSGGMVNCGNLAAGTYTPAVRVTEKRSDLTTADGGWVDGGVFVGTILGVVGSYSVTAPYDVASLSWTAPPGTVAGYNIYRAPDSSGSPGAYVSIGTTTALSFTDTTVKKQNKTFWYKVAAYNANLEGVLSSAFSVKPTYVFYSDCTAIDGTTVASLFEATNIEAAGTIVSNAATFTTSATQWSQSGVSFVPLYTVGAGGQIRYSIKIPAGLATGASASSMFVARTSGNGFIRFYMQPLASNTAEFVLTVHDNGTNAEVDTHYTGYVSNTWYDITVDFLSATSVDIYVGAAKIASAKDVSAAALDGSTCLIKCAIQTSITSANTAYFDTFRIK